MRGTVIISSLLIIFFGKLPTGDLSITRLHNITFCSLSLSEYWKMTFSLSLSLCGWVRLFWFLLLHVSGQFNIFGDQTWNLHFAVEGLFSSWLFFGLLRFIIYDYIGVYFFLFIFIYLYMVKSCMEGYPPSKDLKNELYGMIFFFSFPPDYK